MYVTAIHLQDFSADTAQHIISTLTRLRDELKPALVPGFRSAELLREEGGGGALLLTYWEGRSDLEAFLDSRGGQDAVSVLSDVARAIGGEYRAYRSTWQFDSRDGLVQAWRGES